MANENNAIENDIRQTSPEKSYLAGNVGLNTHRATRNDIKQHINTFNPQNSDANGLAMTSTNIFIYANGGIVGMVQSFNVQESRTIDKLNAIGVEGVIQAVPQNTNGGTLDVNRIALYSSNLWAALGLEVEGKGYDMSGSKVYNKGSEEYSANGNDEKELWDNPTIETNKSIDRPLSNNARFVFKTLKDQRVPLEIQVKTPIVGNSSAGGTINTKNGSQQWYIETYIDCWLSSYNKTYDVGKITVAESCKIDYADVY